MHGVVTVAIPACAAQCAHTGAALLADRAPRHQLVASVGCQLCIWRRANENCASRVRGQTAAMASYSAHMHTHTHRRTLCAQRDTVRGTVTAAALRQRTFAHALDEGGADLLTPGARLVRVVFFIGELCL